MPAPADQGGIVSSDTRRRPTRAELSAVRPGAGRPVAGAGAGLRVIDSYAAFIHRSISRPVGFWPVAKIATR
jgi:hypothetical protein